MNYDSLLTPMNEHSGDANAARVEQRCGTVMLVGWAAYEARADTLYWARELAFKKAIFLGLIALVGLIRTLLRSRAEVVPPPFPPVQPPS